MTTKTIDLATISALLKRELTPHLRDAGFVMATGDENRVTFLCPVELDLPLDGYNTTLTHDGYKCEITQEKQP